MPRDKTVARIVKTIDSLATEIREKNTFNQDTVLNVHGLVCLMRYAIWRDEDSFKQWVIENCEFEINEGVLQRIFLHKSVSENDGVEIRIHIFPYGQATFIHNHQQDFITMCILGSYEYSYYEIINEPGHTYNKYIRVPKSADILPHPDGDENGLLEGKIVEAEIVNGELKPSPGIPPKIFKMGDLPLFVPNDAHHVVNQKEEDLVITIVARRGRRKGKQTTVLYDKEQGHKNPVIDDKPIIEDHNIPLEKKNEIYNSIREALLFRGYDKANETDESRRKKSDVSSYMVKNKFVAKFLKNDADNEKNRKLIHRFMNSNDFTSIPLMDEDKCVNILRVPVSEENISNQLLERKPQPIDINEHIFGAILWNVVSRDLVVPVEDKDGVFQGILSISDIVHSNEDFDRSLIYSIAKKRRDDNGEKTARSFLRRLKRFERKVFDKGGLLKRQEIDHLVNDLLLKLGPLMVISPDLQHGRLKDINSEIDMRTWAEKSAHWPFYKFQIENFDQESISDSLDLLKMLDRGSKMSQILLECGNDVKLLNLNGDIIDFEITSSEITMHSAIKEISKREYPLILKNKNGKFGILTNHDFDSDSAIRELSKLVQNGNIDGALKHTITNHILSVMSGEDSILKLE